MSKNTPATVRQELVTFAAKELEPQGQRAISGMVEVLKFYALVAVLKSDAEAREEVFSQVEKKPKGGRPSKESDLGAIFKKHAPRLNIKSAHRLYDVGRSIADEYEQIVGAKVAKQFALPELVTAEPTALPAPARKKQEELFAYVAGTSQKSWLDKFKPAASKGGPTTKTKKLTPAEEHAQIMEALKTDCESLGRAVDVQLKTPKYRVLNDAQAEGLRDLLTDLAGKIDEWVKMPKTKRPLVDAAKLMLGEEAK